MKAATVKQRRTLGDGRRFVNVVCPYCDGRHWLPDDHTGQCPRRPGQKVIRPAESFVHKGPVAVIDGRRLVERTGKSTTELGRRARFAAMYPTEEVLAHAVGTIPFVARTREASEGGAGAPCQIPFTRCELARQGDGEPVFSPAGLSLLLDEGRVWLIADGEAGRVTTGD